MEKILMAVLKIPDLFDPEIENYFECTSCGCHIFYNKVPLNDEGWTFACSNCGKVYTSL
ncbi:MAG: hypothetical protein NTW30_05520 [Candidatus Aenigmarchaeota archaeon]|nr:hypothetical protein [Candidatus Aenigmarchaeota archaeon]